MTAKQRAARAKFKAVVAEAKKLRKKNPNLTQAQAVKQAWAISYSTKKISGTKYSGLTVEIRPASTSSKKFIVWDTKTNQIFANEKFDSYNEAVDFIKQNDLILKDKKIGYSKEREKLHKNATAWLKKRKKLDADKSKKDRVSLAYQQAPFGKPTVGAIKKKASTKVKAKKSKRTSEMHTDTKSHNVNIKVVSGTKTDIVSKYVKANQDIEKLERVLIRNKETQKKPPYKTDFWRKHFSYQNKLVKKYISELKKHKAELKKLM